MADVKGVFHINALRYAKPQVIKQCNTSGESKAHKSALTSPRSHVMSALWDKHKISNKFALQVALKFSSSF